MSLPGSGRVQASDVNVEIGRAWNAGFNLGDPAVRALAGLTAPNTYISFANLWGKSSYTPMSGGSDGIRYRNTSTTLQTHTGYCYLNLSGGVGPFTYLWEWEDNTGLLVLSDTTLSRCIVTWRTRQGEMQAYLRCTITDSTGRQYQIRWIEVQFAIGQLS